MAVMVARRFGVQIYQISIQLPVAQTRARHRLNMPPIKEVFRSRCSWAWVVALAPVLAAAVAAVGVARLIPLAVASAVPLLAAQISAAALAVVLYLVTAELVVPRQLLARQHRQRLIVRAVAAVVRTRLGVTVPQVL